VHATETILECTDTGLVDIRLVTYTKGIFFSSQGFASRCHVQASGRSLDGGLVLFFCDQFKSICVVVSKLGIIDHLRIDVDTRVDESNGVEMKFNGRSSKAAASNLVILLLEVVGKDCVVMSSVRLAPDAKPVVL
jgi:hypothetical protein